MTPFTPCARTSPGPLPRVNRSGSTTCPPSAPGAPLRPAPRAAGAWFPHRWLRRRNGVTRSPTSCSIAMACLPGSRLPRENLPGGFSAIYDVLKALEESGRIRRGYFVAGLGATQFALPAAVDLLRSLRTGPPLEKAGNGNTRGYRSCESYMAPCCAGRRAKKRMAPRCSPVVSAPA